MKVTIVGAGAIGGVTGAYLARAGVDVTLVDQADDHVEAIRRHGLQVDGLESFNVTIPVLRPGELHGPLELVIVAVKTQHTASALDLLEPHLTAESVVVPLQNGMSAVWIAERIGRSRTIPTSISTNQFTTAPGQVRYNQRGRVHVGESDGRLTPRVEQIAALLATAYDAHASDNVWGFIWAKIVAGSLTFTTALVDAPMGSVLTASDDHRRMFARIGGETAVLAHALGVRLEPGEDLDPNGLLPAAGQHAALEQIDRYAGHYQHVYSGIWRDIAVRKRRTEADTLIQPVIEAGAQHNLPMPLNRAMRQLLREVEDGHRPQAWANLDPLIAIAQPNPEPHN
jgi:2-dehydropantoate 2-reductase